MTDTFRALCAELVDIVTAHCHPDNDAVGYCAAVLSCARAALAEPKPQGPTDKELDELFTNIDQGGKALSWRPYARAVLARWGRPVVEPVFRAKGE